MQWDMAYRLADHLREADLREMHAVSPGESEVSECWESIASSEECWYAETEDGELITVWGRLRRPVGKGNIIWCLGTDKVEAYKIPFARRSRRIVREWADKYGPLMNAVAVKNTLAHDWLAWCGASFSNPFDVNGEPFQSFVIQGKKR